MAINKKQRGFALYVAVIFMSVMLTLGLTLASLGYKQQILASGSVRSQDAFYVADAMLECALYADQQQNLFAYPAVDPGVAPAMICGGASPNSSTETWDASKWVINSWLSMDSGQHCANVMISKPNPAIVGGVTYIFSQGYDVPCGSVGGAGRFASRGMSARY